MSARVQSIIVSGTAGTIVDIECHLSNNLPTIVIVGFANRSVGESKERIRGAFATSHIMLPRKRITVNLAPADVPKADSGFDLAIAVSILASSAQVVLDRAARQAFIGELGLDGSTRAVRGIIGKITAGRAKGIDTFYIPTANLGQAQMIPQVNLIAVDNLSQLHSHLSGEQPVRVIDTGGGKYRTSTGEQDKPKVQLSEIVGQAQAKRALEIAAAGGHNILFSGPPGTGKSMLASALPGLLPPLDREEILEVTHLHSLASQDYEQIVTGRPFRAPHHSASLVAVTGGGLALRPGEISLAHRGILFFDELPEFNRETLEALRQPLENRTISVTRAHGTADYPANFIFAATANPCPCGYAGTSNACECQQTQITSYRNRISGPIIDRIDLYSDVSEIDHERLLTQPLDPESDQAARKRVSAARQAQTRRFASVSQLNADMSNADIKRLRIHPEALSILNLAARNLNLSARAYMRTIKVARTIADLESATAISGAHLAEALNYRPAISENK